MAFIFYANYGWVQPDIGNIDYQDFLAWLDKGNEPTPCSPPEVVTPHG